MLLVVIGLTGCNSAGVPRVSPQENAIYQLVATIDKDDATPPVTTPALGTTGLFARDGELEIFVPQLSRRGPSGLAFMQHVLVGGAYAETLTLCGVIEDLLIERTDGGSGLSDRVSARLTQTWSATVARDRSCNVTDEMPDSDGETVVTLTYDVKERCPCSVGLDLSSDELHCAACPTR
jgi:hypothetical protein